MPRASPPGSALAYGGLLALAVALAYAQVLRFDFINFDDPLYVTDNPVIHAGVSLAGIRWAATATHAANWHPLTWLSHMLDWQLWADNPAGHHAASVVIHLANTLLVFTLLRVTTGRTERSAVVAALFGLHPTRVESVAWVAERKDVLSTLFWLLTALGYVRYTHRETARRYAWVCAAFAAALLSKPMVVTLPVILLLLDWWPLARWRTVAWRALVIEKVPLVALAAASALATVAAQRAGGAVVTFEHVALLDRLANAAVSCWRYVGVLLWPSGLAIFYPYTRWPPGVAAAAALALVVCSVWIVRARARRAALAFGWCWYLAMLLPVVGIVQVGSQAMADRYTYLPAVGLFVAAVWTACDAHWLPPWALRLCGWLLPLPLLALTARQAQFWSDSATLWTRALAVTEENGTAHIYLGEALAKRGAQSEADEHHRRAVALNPRSAAAQFNYGNLLMREGKFDEAGERYRLAIALDPRFPGARNGQAVLLAKRDDLDAAEASLRAALALNPVYADALANLGDLLVRRARPAEAIDAYRAAQRQRPGWNDLALQIARQLALLGDLPAAASELRAAIAADPAAADAYAMLGQVLQFSGDRDGARAAYAAALQRKPDWPEVQRALDALHTGSAAGS